MHLLNLMKSIKFLESLLLQRESIALHRVILLISPMVVILIAILGLAVQLNRQISDQQKISINRIAHVTVRNFAQLQREQLRLSVLIERSASEFARQPIILQRDLVWSRLRVLENPRHIQAIMPEVNELLQAYRTDWVALQPLLEQWLQDHTAQALRTELLTALEKNEKRVNQAISLSQLSYEDRIIEWSASSQHLNGLLTGASIVFVFMILLTTYVLYQFFQVQARIEQGLRNSEQRLRAILDTIPDAVCRLTRNGVFVDVKPAQNLAMPLDPGALLGQQITEVWHTAITSVMLPAMEQAFGTGQEQWCEYQLLDERTMQVRNFEARILPSGVNEVQIIVRDNTIDKQHEESVLQAQKLESLGVLAGGIAHDFNNLLTGMLAQSSLAKVKLSKGLPAIDNIDKAILSAERAADLTRQLLAYAGKGKFQIAPLDLNQLIHDTTGLLQTALPSQAELHRVLDPELPLIEADRGQIQQVVMNLVINAVEALGENGGMIRIVTRCQQFKESQAVQGHLVGNLPPGRYVSLQIADSGMGMDQVLLSRIFDPFFSTKPKGHGLGLSATLGILHTHQGGLQVQSQLGRGTTFTILLPLLTTTPVASQAIVPTLSAASKLRQTVLVIDDDEAISEVAVDILMGHGFTVITAASGQEGVDQFRRLQKQIGAILLDMKMPGMNGKQTYQLLCQIEPNVKVIFMSGYSETEVTMQLGNGRLLPFLSKPYSADLLIHHVQQMLASV